MGTLLLTLNKWEIVSGDLGEPLHIDETGLWMKLARLRGRAPRGERCRAGVPHGHWETTTFTGALRLTGMTAPFVYDGAMNGIVFLAFVEQVLVPTLHPGDIVIMDNLPAHKAAGIHNAIETAGANLLYLPPYNPDFNPIETPSQSSRRCCGHEQKGRSMRYGTRSAASSRSLLPPNVLTTSGLLDVTGLNRTCSSSCASTNGFP